MRRDGFVSYSDPAAHLSDAPPGGVISLQLADVCTRLTLRSSGARRSTIASIGVLAVVASLLALVALAASPAAATGTISATFSSLACTSTQTASASAWGSATAPAGATSATFTLTGAGGGAGDTGNATGGKGGAGATVSGVVGVTPGQVLWAKLGCGGTDSGTQVYADGYTKGAPSAGFVGGGGGGSTALCVGTATADCGGSTKIVAIAAGGGGGGGASLNGSAGGAGGNAGAAAISTGGTTGENGGNGLGGLGGQNGTTTNTTERPYAGGGGGGTVVAGSTNSTTTGGLAAANGAGGSSGRGSNGGGANTTATPKAGAAGVSGPANPAVPSVTPGTAGNGGLGGEGSRDAAQVLIEGGGGGGGLAGGGGGGGGNCYGNTTCGTANSGAAGGGGGSSWALGSTPISGTPTFSTVNNTVDCTLQGIGATSAGYGSTNNGGRGCHGWVTVTWVVNSTGTSFTTAPSNGAAGGVLATQPVVRALNGSTAVAGENITLTYSGTTLAGDAASGNLPCATNPVATDASGNASFAGCSVPTPGSMTITATNGTTSATDARVVTITAPTTTTWSATTSAGCGAGSVALSPTAETLAITVKGAGGGSAGGGWDSTSGAGGSGGLSSVSGYALPRQADLTQQYPAFKYEGGCAGGGGQTNGSGAFSGASAASGGAGGAGWGDGGTGGGADSVGYNIGHGGRAAAGGGGGGGSVACFGPTTGTGCGAATQPLLVSGGGAGGGATARAANGGAGGAGNAGLASAAEQWYSTTGSAFAGAGYGGAGGVVGLDGRGGGGGGGVGTAGGSNVVAAPTGAGTAGGNNGGGGGGASAGGGVSGAGTGVVGSGGDGGVGAAGKTGDYANGGGGGGGGGYFGGGGGGGDYYDSGSGSGGGGGGGSSWAATNLNGTITTNSTSGSAGGSAVSANTGGNGGTDGSVSMTVSGRFIITGTPVAQATSKNVAATAYSIPATAGTATAAQGCCYWGQSGLPTGITINSTTGVMSGTPTATAGTYPVTLTLHTSGTGPLLGGAQAYATVTFNWVIRNDAPVPSGVSHSVARGASVTFSLSATDPNGDPLTYAAGASALPSGATVTCSLAGSCTVTVAANTAPGSSTFAWTASDGLLSGSTNETVVITNTAPVATGATHTIGRGSSSTFNLSAADANGDTLDGSVSGSGYSTVVTSGLPAGSTISCTSAGACTVTIASGTAPGNYTYTWKVNDNASTSNTATETIAVTNTAPVTAPLTVNGVQRGRPASESAFSLTSTDANSDPVTYAVVSSAGLPSGSSLTCSTLGACTVGVPANSAVQNYSFTYRVNDNNLTSNTSTVTVGVGNTTPVANAVGPLHTTVGASLSVPLSSTDFNGDTVTYAAPVTSPAKGGVTGSGATRTYIATNGTKGADSFTFTASDNGPATSDPGTVAIVIDNTAPTATAQTVASAPRGTAGTITLAGTDVNGDPLTFAVQATTTKGTLSCTSAGACTYTASMSSSGTDSFTFVANDGTANSAGAATVTINITRGDQVPTSGNVPDTAVRIGQAVRIDLPVTDLDGYTANTSGDEGAATVSTSGATGGTVSCLTFVVGTTGLASGKVPCNFAVPTTATVGDHYGFSFTVSDTHGGTSSSYSVSGTISARSAPAGSVSCKNGPSGTVITTVATGIPSWCSVTFTDVSSAGSGPFVTGGIVADSPVSPGAVSVTVGSSPTAGDFLAADGSIGDGAACTTAPTTAGVSACSLAGPVIFQTAGTPTLSTGALPADSAHLAGAAATGSLSVTQSCAPKVYDAPTVAAPTTGYVDNGQFRFVAYNLGCGSVTSDKFGYAYGIGNDPALGAEGYLTETVSDVGADGSAAWSAQVDTDPGTSIDLRFFGRTSAQAPDSYTTAAHLATQVQWLSSVYVISIDGARSSTSAQTITFPAFSTIHDSTVTLDARATSGLPVTYAASGSGCGSLSGKQLTLGSTVGASCAIVATQAGGGMWAAASTVTKTVKVTASAQTITFTKPTGALTAGVTTVHLTSAQVYAGSGLPITIAVAGPGCSSSDTTLPADVAFLTIESCKVTATQPGNATTAPAVAQTWSPKAVGQAQTITFTKTATAAVVGGHATLTADDLHASSGLPVTVSVVGPGCSTADATLPITVSYVASTSCKVTVTQTGSTLWAAATAQSWAPKIAGQSQSISFPQPASPRPANTTIDLSGVTASSGLPVTIATSGACTNVGSTVTLTTAGTCTIVASQLGDTSWAKAAAVTRKVVVAS